MDDDPKSPLADEPYSIAGIAAAYTYSSLNHTLFPSRGFRGSIENHVRFTPRRGDDSPLDNLKPFDLVSADLTAAIPLGDRFSIGAFGFWSSVFGEPELPSEISTFGPEKIQRIYFPHAPGIFSGEQRAALSLALQFEPLKNLSLLGGRLVFSLAVAAGLSGSFEWNEWKDFDREDIIWNASFGPALIPARNFGLYLRAGAGGGGGHRAAPFVSFDMGMSRFQKRLF
jgi:hypothetical protein